MASNLDASAPYGGAQFWHHGVSTTDVAIVIRSGGIRLLGASPIDVMAFSVLRTVYPIYFMEP
jgi:hypothetical protein